MAPKPNNSPAESKSVTAMTSDIIFSALCVVVSCIFIILINDHFTYLSQEKDIKMYLDYVPKKGIPILTRMRYYFVSFNEEYLHVMMTYFRPWGRDGLKWIGERSGYPLGSEVC